MNNKLTKKDINELQKEFDYRKGPLTMEIAHEKIIIAISPILLYYIY